MKRIVVKHKPIIELSLTADDWELYNLDGRDDAAVTLNRQIEEVINSASTFGDALRGIDKCLTNQAEFGASDTEGHCVARIILNQAYPA